MLCSGRPCLFSVASVMVSDLDGHVGVPSGGAYPSEPAVSAPGAVCLVFARRACLGRKGSTPSAVRFWGRVSPTAAGINADEKISQDEFTPP